MQGKPINSLIVLLLLCIFSLSPTWSAKCEDLITIEAISLTVYFDGYVLVHYETQVDPSYPTVNLTLIGEIFENTLVVDENGLPLDYSIIEDVIIVHGLGAQAIEITYYTQDLTSKIGRYWTLQADVPINTTVTLPDEASIVSLNVVPEVIESRDGQVILLMPAGLFEITYVATKRPSPSSPNYELFVITIAAILVLGALAYWLARMRRRTQPPEKKSIEPRINLEKLFKEHKDLRPEEQQTIKFLAENNGKAFEAEVYEKLQLPRTTTWRMIKRLEKMRIITITKSRRQNLVFIRTKYRIEKGKKETKS